MPCYKLNEAKMFSDIADGVAIVINSETGIYYGMNELGTAVFEKIMAGASTEAIGAALASLPGAPNNMQARLENFITDLKAHEILLAGPAGAQNVTIAPAIAAASDFAITVQEFNDAQDLLLADPIHEVKPEQGWQPDKAVLEEDEDLIAARESKLKH